MCVESNQWCVIGASGESIAAIRCMNAGGPNAGSPGSAVVLRATVPGDVPFTTACVDGYTNAFT